MTTKKPEPKTTFIKDMETCHKFVDTWNTSQSVKDIADKLSLTKPAVNSIARHLRSQGIYLKLFLPGRPRKQFSYSNLSKEQIYELNGDALADDFNDRINQ